VFSSVFLPLTFVTGVRMNFEFMAAYHRPWASPFGVRHAGHRVRDALDLRNKRWL